ncbi:hypothetical protein QGN29_11685 [Temperatibacter marinus]|uniref:Uncharacterized protein n=1 Tax=Temperatibacter marinus TaxID=1456591 RepID=A0AA52H973_9PROT|nr:hypothetical protein [Temperatibacter marinus]WND02212.1 hypothetical protein QGN29_11685 [Temperatibacter marinus]
MYLSLFTMIITLLLTSVTLFVVARALEWQYGSREWFISTFGFAIAFLLITSADDHTSVYLVFLSNFIQVLCFITVVKGALIYLDIDYSNKLYGFLLFSVIASMMFGRVYEHSSVVYTGFVVTGSIMLLCFYALFKIGRLLVQKATWQKSLLSLVFLLTMLMCSNRLYDIFVNGVPETTTLLELNDKYYYIVSINSLIICSIFVVLLWAVEDSALNTFTNEKGDL